MSMENLDDLIKSWVKAQSLDPRLDAYKRFGWAVDELIDMAYQNPEKLWILIPNIINYDSSKKTLGAIGAGLIEDLLIYHGREFINKVIELASTNPAFKKALQYTFLDSTDAPSDIISKLETLKESMGSE